MRPRRQSRATEIREPLELAVEVLRGHARTGRRPRDLLADRFDALAIGPAQRRQVAHAVYRTVQQERRAAFALGGVDHLSPDARTLALLLATLALDGELEPGRAAWRFSRHARGRVDWDALTDVDRRIARVADPVARFGIRHSLPDWIAARLVDELGGDAERLAAALNEPPPRTIRANLLRVRDRDELARELATAGVATRPTRFAPHGLIVEGDAPLYELAAFHAGHFEQQDEASQLCALVVAPPPHGRVLDACAGGGGKTLALAAALQNHGEILACDVHERRLEGLVPRRRRAGVDVVRSLLVTEDAWPDEVAAFARRADRILLDVPCSGVGSWRRRTDARWGLTPDSCAALRRIQGELLERAVAHLAPGARVIYATCTVFRDENEAQVEAALAAHPELELVRITEILGKATAAAITDPTGTFLRLWPHVHGSDGFFAAVLRRRRG